MSSSRWPTQKKSVVFWLTFCLICLCLGNFCLSDLLLSDFPFLCSVFLEFFFVAFYFVKVYPGSFCWHVCFLTRERKDVVLGGRGVEMIWEVLGEGKF